MIFFFVLLLLVLLAQIAEFFIPVLPWLYDAHVYVVPVIVFYGAMALPFPLMLALALYAGILLDALTVQVIGGKVEISTGSSILIYGVLAGVMHGLRPLFARGRWEVHCILSGVFTSLIVLAQYLMITFRRGSIVFTREIWWQIGGPGLVAMAMAPILFWFLQWMGRMTAYSYQPEGDGWNEQAPYYFACPDSIGRPFDADGFGRSRPQALVDSGGAWPGMDVSAPW